jgi:hypothetical protein
MDNVHALGVYSRLSYADNDVIAETISDEALSQFEQYQQLETPEHPTAYNVYADAQAAEYALTQAGSAEGPALRDALVGDEFTAILGESTINERGQPSIPGSVIRFEADGDNAAVDSVEWSGQLPSITNIPPETDL